MKTVISQDQCTCLQSKSTFSFLLYQFEEGEEPKAVDVPYGIICWRQLGRSVGSGARREELHGVEVGERVPAPGVVGRQERVISGEVELDG